MTYSWLGGAPPNDENGSSYTYGPAGEVSSAARSTKHAELRTTTQVRLAHRLLPRPVPHVQRRKEIVLRAGTAADAAACSALDATYTTNHIWQMDTRQEGEELRICFRLVRLPRELTLVAEHRPPVLPYGAPRRGLLWLVAAEIEASPPVRAEAQAEDDAPRPAPGHRDAGPGRVVGYAVAAATPGEERAYVRTLVVDRAYRRGGIGRWLLAEARRWAANYGAVRLMADALACNYPSLRLLQKSGFSFCGYNDSYWPSNDVAIFFSTRLR